MTALATNPTTSPDARVYAWLAEFEAAMVARDVERAAATFALRPARRPSPELTGNLMRLCADEARARFVGARVARLATVSAAGVPHLVPVTFAVLGERIVFVVDDKPKSTTRLRRLDNIAARPQVCLLADVYQDDWTQLWWARADGAATVRTTDAAAIDALAARYPAYVERRPRGPVVSIEVTAWTGWAAAGTPDPGSI